MLLIKKVYRLLLFIALSTQLFSQQELQASGTHSFVKQESFGHPHKIKRKYHSIKKQTKPNLLLFIVDEQRFPTTYESDELKEWKRINLPFQTMLAEKGTVFHNHYANTNACCPSREPSNVVRNLNSSLLVK